MAADGVPVWDPPSRLEDVDILLEGAEIAVVPEHKNVSSHWGEPYALQKTLLEKIKPGAGVLVPRRHGVTWAFAHYVRTHANEVTTYIAPSRRLARKFEKDTDHGVKAISESDVEIRGVNGFVLLDGCTNVNAFVMMEWGFTAFSPEFTIPQARKLWFKGTAAQVVVAYDREGWLIPHNPSIAEAYSVRFSDTRVWCSKTFCIGEDIDVLISDLRYKIRACTVVCRTLVHPRWCEESIDKVYIEEVVYLEGDDLVRLAGIQSGP